MKYKALNKTTAKINSFFYFKSAIILFVVFFLAFMFLAYPDCLTKGINNGLILCFEKVIASLFPFMILSDFLLKSGISELISAPFAKTTEKCFKLPKETAATIIMSLICGYPVGPSMAKELYDSKIISFEHYRHLMLFCVNPSISFCISFIGAALYNNLTIGIIIYISSLLSTLITGIITSYKSKEVVYSYAKNITTKQINFSSALTDSIMHSTRSMIFICSTVVIFSSLCELTNLFSFPPFISTIISFFLEITNFAKNNYNCISVSAMSAAITFGGLCVHMQIMPNLVKAKIKYSVFIAFRLISSIISFVFSKILMYLYPYDINTSVNINNSANLTKAGLPVSLTLIIMAIIVILTDNTKQRFKNIV